VVGHCESMAAIDAQGVRRVLRELAESGPKRERPGIAGPLETALAC
jgi:hypothetical protein